MSEENKAIVRHAMLNFFSNGQLNWDTLNGYFAPDCIFHQLPTGLEGLAGLKKFYDIYLSGYSNLQNRMLGELIADGDFVVAMWEMTGIHTGELRGFSATGAHLRLTGIDIVRIANGKVVERWQEANHLGILQQLQAAANDTGQ